MKIPASAMPRFAGLKEKISGDADNADLRKAILEALPKAVEQTKNLAPYFRATNERETAKKIFDFLKQRVKYKADDYRQVIQLPSAILRPGAIADCKSLSLFTAAVLQNLGIPWDFVLASYTDSTIPGHIYVVTDSGIIIDVVWGKFNSEKKAKYKYKMPFKGANNMKYTSITGLGATESAQEWAIRNGIWYSFSPGERAGINLKKVSPVHIAARNLLLTAIAGNAGGLASMLKILDEESKGSPATNPKFKQSSFDKKRDIEIQWLQQGGNPNELYDAINKGYTKKARGKYFAKLIEDSSKGINIRVDQWLRGIFSALFGKKYTPGIGTGEPVTTTGTTGAIIGSAPTWTAILKGLAATLGTALITAVVTKVASDPVEEKDETPTPGFGPGPAPGPTPTGGKNTMLIIGGVAVAAALVYFATKKKK